MSGIQEILVLVIIILAIFFVPRMIPRREERQPLRPWLTLSGKMRLAIAASIIWLGLTAAYLQPWQKDLMPFIYTGPGPVIVVWIIYWVFVGFRKK